MILARTVLSQGRTKGCCLWRIGAEIRRLYRSERLPIKVIARVVGCSKNTVKSALASEGPPRYERARVGSIVDEVEPRIRELQPATAPAG